MLQRIVKELPTGFSAAGLGNIILALVSSILFKTLICLYGCVVGCWGDWSCSLWKFSMSCIIPVCYMLVVLIVQPVHICFFHTVAERACKHWISAIPALSSSVEKMLKKLLQLWKPHFATVRMILIWFSVLDLHPFPFRTCELSRVVHSSLILVFSARQTFIIRVLWVRSSRLSKSNEI